MSRVRIKGHTRRLKDGRIVRIRPYVRLQSRRRRKKQEEEQEEELVPEQEDDDEYSWVEWEAGKEER